MVDGITLVFKKDLMLKRIEAEGLMHHVSEKELRMMDNLDGQEVSSASWNRRVNDAPVYSCKGKDGTIHDVYEKDCVPAGECKT